MKKRVLGLVVCVCMVLVFAACGSSNGLKNLGNYKGLAVTKTVSEVTQEDIDISLEAFGTEYAVLKDVADRDTVRSSDVVTIDYVGTVDGKSFEDGTATDYILELGEGLFFLDDFEPQLIGMKAGEQKTIQAVFPDDYDADTALAGKTAVMEVTLKKIQYYDITVTDEMVAANTDYKSVDEYIEAVRQLSGETSETTALENMQSDLLNMIVADSEFDEITEEQIAPVKADLQEYWEYYIYYYFNGWDLVTYLGYTGMSEEEFDLQMRESAILSIKRDMVLLAIADEEDIQISDEQYTSMVQDIVNEYQYESIEAFEDDYESKDEIVENLRRDLALEFVVDNAVITVVNE